MVTPQTQTTTLEALPMEDDFVVTEFLKNEEAFLQRATMDEVLRLMRYFRERAFAAVTPQEHEFFAERAQQLALYA